MTMIIPRATDPAIQTIRAKVVAAITRQDTDSVKRLIDQTESRDVLDSISFVVVLLRNVELSEHLMRRLEALDNVRSN